MSQTVAHARQPRDGITDAEFLTIEAALAALPVRWFVAHLDTDYNGTNNDGEYAFATLERVAGPPIGISFGIGLESGGYSISHTISYHEPIDIWDPCSTLEEALSTFTNYILDSIRSWGLQVAA